MTNIKVVGVVGAGQMGAGIAQVCAMSGYQVYLWDAASGRCIQTFHAPHPYQGMNITGVTGISETQRAALKALGAVEASP